MGRNQGNNGNGEGEEKERAREQFPPFSQIIWFTQLLPSYQERKKEIKNNALSIYLFIYAKMKQ